VQHGAAGLELATQTQGILLDTDPVTGGHRQLAAAEHSGSAGQCLLRTDILRGAARGSAGRSHSAAAGGARGGVGRDGFAATAAAAAVPIASGIVEQQAEPGVELVLLQLLI